MASRSSNITAVHFTLVFFVMATLILGVMTYLNYNDLQVALAQVQEANKKYEDERNLRRTQDDELAALKNIIGHALDRIGVDETDNPNTVLGALTSDLNLYVGTNRPATVAACLADLRTQLNNALAARDALAVELQQHKDLILGLRREYQVMVDQEKAARNQADAQLQALIRSRDEAISAKDQRIAQLDAEVRNITLQLTQEQQARREEKKQLEQHISDLKRINTRIQEQIDQEARVSFEVPDGQIHWVDHINNKVWINLGSVDLLPERTTFSVYAKSHQGVARNQEDIKGAIEVTRIIDGHMAEARILDEDMYRPFAKGDPIYTPLWSPGRPAKIAFVGLVDLDGDGKSDRQMLHDLIAAHGAEITAEVDDFGEYNGKMIDVDTKFLVIGQIPSPVVGGIEAENKIATKIAENHTKLVEMARLHAVRRISLSDFLEWIGYRPKRRIWRPGDTREFTLKAGAQSTAVNETIGDRASSGQVSRVFTNQKGRKQDVSEGQTSKVYGGGK